MSNIFNEPIISSLKGNVGLGHTRYSTTGGTESIQLAQPFIVHTSYGCIAVAHNGELVNSQSLRQKILDKGEDNSFPVTRLLHSPKDQLILMCDCSWTADVVVVLRDGRIPPFTPCVVKSIPPSMTSTTVPTTKHSTTFKRVNVQRVVCV